MAKFIDRRGSACATIVTALGCIVAFPMCNAFDDPPNRSGGIPTPAFNPVPTFAPTPVTTPLPSTPVTPVPVVVTQVPRPPIPTATILPGATFPPEAGVAAPDASSPSSGETKTTNALDAGGSSPNSSTPVEDAQARVDAASDASSVSAPDASVTDADGG